MFSLNQSSEVEQSCSSEILQIIEHFSWHSFQKEDGNKKIDNTMSLDYYTLVLFLDDEYWIVLITGLLFLEKHQKICLRPDLNREHHYKWVERLPSMPPKYKFHPVSYPWLPLVKFMALYIWNESLKSNCKIHVFFHNYLQNYNIKLFSRLQLYFANEKSSLKTVVS